MTRTQPAVQVGVRPVRRRVSPLVVRNTINGLLFVAPWLIGFLIFTLYPILASFYYSFTEFDAISSPDWVGLDNYRTLLTVDPNFWTSVGNTLFYALIA